MSWSPESESNFESARLGPLERRLLQQIWIRRSATVRELLADSDMRLAYTTVMTTLDRLFKKGLLERTEQGRAFRYSARCSPAELPRFLMVNGMRRWLQSTGTPSLPLSYFVDAISAHDVKLLDELRVLVEQKRQELKNKANKK
jgi:predicted transcriptional regulator